MAEPIKYVQLDCHFDDDKIDIIEAEFGLAGFAIVVKLFQKIYGGLGYYCEWNDRVALLFAKKIGAGGNVVREVVHAAIKENIFSKEMFEKYGILTSHGIQKRFADVAKRRAVIFDKPEYVLSTAAQKNTVFYDDVNNQGSNVCNQGSNVCNETTSKVKQSKDKLSEVKQSSERSAHADCTRKTLVGKYGETIVQEYERRFRVWHGKNPTAQVNMYGSISKWIEKDGVEASVNTSSFDVDDIMNDTMLRYKEGK